MTKKSWRPSVYHPSEQYDEDAWNKLRRKVMRRDRCKCYRCGKRSKSTVGLSAHHIIPRKEGGRDYLENLITLCNPCHDYVELMEFRSLAEILNSADDSPIETKEKGYTKLKKKDRSDWHLWVYGGVTRPRQKRPKKTNGIREKFIEEFLANLNHEPKDRDNL